MLKIQFQVLSDPDKKEKYDMYGPNLRPDGDSDDDYSEDEEHYMSFFEIFMRARGFPFQFYSHHHTPNPGQRGTRTGYSSSYSTHYERQYTSDFETKEKKKRETNVKSTFTTKGNRDDDYDIDMVLKKLGETEINSSKKKCKK